MATYREIRQYVESQYGFVPQTSWAAEVKELCNIPPKRVAVNRLGKDRGKHNLAQKPKSKVSKQH